MGRSFDWFDIGAQALERVTNGAFVDIYACPLCLQGFDRGMATGSHSKLSREHAPPAWYGGSKIALTCKKCNNDIGAPLDNAMRELVNLVSFVNERKWFGAQPLKAEVELKGSGAPATAIIQAIGDGMIISCDPNINENASHERHAIAWEDFVNTGSTKWGMNVQIHTTYEHRNRLIGLLKSAYIVAFAALGYRYILQPEVRNVRRQILAPHRLRIPTFSVTSPQEPTETRRLFAVDYPARLRSLIVQMGKHIVFLPHPAGNPTLYEALWRERNEPAEESFRGHDIPWPSRPMHTLDL